MFSTSVGCEALRGIYQRELGPLASGAHSPAHRRMLLNSSDVSQIVVRELQGRASCVGAEGVAVLRTKNQG